MSRKPVCVLVVVLAVAAAAMSGVSAAETEAATQSLTASLRLPQTHVGLPPLCVAVGEEETCTPTAGTELVGGELQVVVDYTLSSVTNLPVVDLRAGGDIACDKQHTGTGLVAALSRSSFKQQSFVTAVATSDGKPVAKVRVPVKSKEREPRVAVTFCG